MVDKLNISVVKTQILFSLHGGFLLLQCILTRHNQFKLTCCDGTKKSAFNVDSQGERKPLAEPWWTKPNTSIMRLSFDESFKSVLPTVKIVKFSENKTKWLPSS